MRARKNRQRPSAGGLSLTLRNSLLRRTRIQPRRRNLPLAFVVVVELHLMVGLRASHRFLAFRAESSLAGLGQQRLFRCVRSFVQQFAGRSLGYDKYAERVSVVIRDTNV